MSHYSPNPLKELEESILKVLGISKTERCAIQIGDKGKKHFATFRYPDGDRPRCIATHDDGLIFAGGSLFKVFIAIAVSLIIERLSTRPNSRYSRLQGAWERSFTEVFNECSKDSKGYQIGPLDGEPTVLNLVFHVKGPCNITHLLLSPQGNPLLSENEFLNLVTQYSHDTRQRNDTNKIWCQYSNANYILLALLIEVASGMKLHTFLKEHIFKRLGMHRTYMTAGELNSLPSDQRVQPHLVSGDGTRRAIVFDTIPYLADTVEIATTGGYTCAGDVGIFFQAIEDALNGTLKDDLFDAAFAKSLFIGLASIDGKEHHGYTRFGLRTTLDEDLPGSHSLNRLVSPDSDCSNYTLGLDSEGKTVAAYYMAGTVNGWACTVYFLRGRSIYVVVLTNTSSPLDSSDIISRLCIQEILRLRPSKLGDPNFSLRWERMTPMQAYRAHYVELAARMYEENARAFRELEEKDSAQDTLIPDHLRVCGTYTNKSYGQTLEVIESELAQEHVLRVILHGKSKISKQMRFVYKGNVFRICSLGCPGLSVDCFGDWQNLEFEFEEMNGEITSLSRRGVKLVDVFSRDD